MPHERNRSTDGQDSGAHGAEDGGDLLGLHAFKHTSCFGQDEHRTGNGNNARNELTNTIKVENGLLDDITSTVFLRLLHVGQ